MPTKELFGEEDKFNFVNVEYESNVQLVTGYTSLEKVPELQSEFLELAVSGGILKCCLMG